ncbi:MAG: hypothetical protein F2813_01270 [Actinobacteria bacterium]|uniref:Unannotated protein n=1 Tax=freshwater metagenome TaxID=449393 RepID=A0A6J5ZBP7_9ZZZZ|nr:hypothetical protein [Actinomycetota bacterium]
MLLPRIAKISLLIVLFLIVSFFVARWLTAENRERAAVTKLLRAEAEGDSAQMLELLDGCAERPACRAVVVSNARRLKASGPVTILRYDSGTSYALSSANGASRVAWDVGGSSAATVQCIEVKRSGNQFINGSITLTSISRPLPGISACPN